MVGLSAGEARAQDANYCTLTSIPDTEAFLLAGSESHALIYCGNLTYRSVAAWARYNDRDEAERHAEQGCEVRENQYAPERVVQSCELIGSASRRADGSIEVYNKFGRDPNLRMASCRDHIRTIPYNSEGDTSWNEGNIDALCGPVESIEPAACFDAVMFGGLDYGGGTNWSWSNALDLCARSPKASATIMCFEEKMPDVGWREAIAACKAA